MIKVTETVVIIHNLIVELKRDNYARDGSASQSNLYNDNGEKNNISFIKLPTDELPLFLHSSVIVSDDITIKRIHRALKPSLLERQ